MKRSLSLFAVMLLGMLGAASASACDLPTWPAPLATCPFPDPLNNELNDWGMIYQDAKTTGCETNARSYFSDKLNNTNAAGGWSGFLGGGAAWFAYQTGLVLGAKNLLTPDLDVLIGNMNYNPSISADCGFNGVASDGIARWRHGDTCMDDYMVAAAAYGWRTAYMRKTGRPWTSDRANTISNIVNGLDTDSSICISKQNPGSDPNYYTGPKGPCNGSPADLASGAAVVLPFNHVQESAPYGIGMITSMANAYLGLEIAGDPVNASADFGSNLTNMQYIMQALFEEGQHAAASADTWRYACYAALPGASTLTNSDVDPANRNRNCDDRIVGGYKPGMFPVVSFYSGHGWSTGANFWDYQFNGPGFPHSDFQDGNRCAFYGAARHEVYYTDTRDWWINPGNRVPFEGGGSYPIAIRTWNGNYLTAEGNGGSSVVANRWSIGPWETFTIAPTNGGTLNDGSDVTIRTSSNWYFSALYGGGYSMLADKTAVGPWETFHVVKISDANGRPGSPIADGDTFALQAQSTGTTYDTTAEGGGGGTVNVNRTSIGPWETFTYVRQ